MDRSELLQALQIDRDAPPPDRRAWRWLALAIVAAGLAATGWLVARPAAVAVQVAAAKTLAAPPAASPVLDATGYVTARRQATVSAKVTGRVEEVLIEEGQHVETGEVIARLDPIDAEAEHALATARLAAARAERADLEVQLAQARRDYAREQELSARKLTPEQSVEDARTRVRSLEARIATQRRQIEVALRSVELAQVGLDNLVVRAPFAGVVTVKAAQPGEIVSPISAGGGFTRTGIGTIVDMASLEIEVDVNEAYISRVAPGQPVEAVLNAYPEWRIAAEVITIIPAADRAKATVKVRIALLERDPRIVPDMGVRVSFLERDEAGAAEPVAGVVVPAAAIVDAGGEATVYVLAEHRARRRSVVLGQAFGESRQVVGGLQAGERVILDPPAGLTDGQRVEVAGDG